MPLKEYVMKKNNKRKNNEYTLKISLGNSATYKPPQTHPYSRFTSAQREELSIQIAGNIWGNICRRTTAI